MDDEIDRRAKELTEALSGYRKIYKAEVNKSQDKSQDWCTRCDNCKHSQVHTKDYNYCSKLRGFIRKDNRNFCINHSDNNGNRIIK